jgi:hypothetical protein
LVPLVERNSDSATARVDSGYSDSLIYIAVPAWDWRKKAGGTV